MSKKDPIVILKTVNNGSLTVSNVPHTYYPNGYGSDGEKEYIPANVMYKSSMIFRKMIDEKIADYSCLR